MRVTGERDGFLTRPLSYFEDMYDTLAPNEMCKLYLAKLNTKQALANIEEELAQTEQSISNLQAQLQNKELNEKKRQKLQNKLEPEANKLNNLTQQKEELQKLYEEHPAGITMSGIIATYFGNKSWYLYGASDNVYREFMPNYYIQWQAFTEAKKAGYEIYDFFGISGKTDESDPLYGPNYSHNLKNSRKNYVRKSIKKSVPRLRNTFFIQFEVFYVKFLLLLHDHLIQYFHFSNIEPFHDHDLQLRQYHFSELY